VEKTVEKARVKTREKVIDLIKNNPKITTAELAEILEITVKGVEWNLAKLKEKGIIKRIGPAKGGYWKVIEK
jgi:ATP-dependent DNA helicase RecG